MCSGVAILTMNTLSIKLDEIAPFISPKLSESHLTKQRLINELADGVNERHCWPDDSSPDYRPKFRVFTGKAPSKK
jgi:hypothetical protein